MAKKSTGMTASSSKASTSTPVPAIKKRATISEIDDIFSKKSKPSRTPEVSIPVAPMDKKKKSKKGKQEVVAVEVEPSVKAKGKAKQVEPETIIDPSAIIDSYRNAAAPGTKKRKATEEGGDDAQGGKKEGEEEERFMDSRGTTRRRTDDGLPIYDISELKIGLGGDSELCPFDCDCCF